MRYAAGHKEQTRTKILRAAGRVFRRLGYHAAGVDAVMREAGLTPGGFYAHFPSKEALFAEALPAAATEAAAGLGPDVVGPGPLVDRYLSPHHHAQCEEGCPLPTLVSEVARCGDPVRAGFAGLVEGLASQIQADNPTDPPTRERALALAALCVGGMAVARSVADPELADRILAACRDLAHPGPRPAD